MSLATSLSNLAAFLNKAGRPQEAIEPAEEATAYLRQLAQTNPGIYLPKLDAGLRNFAIHLSDAGKDDQAEELFSDVLREFSSSTNGTGRVLLARGYWRARQEEITEAISDLLTAVTAFDRENDYLARGEARQALIALRKMYATAFDVQWDKLNESKPIWLQHINDTQQLADEIITWVQTADLDESSAYLDDKSSSLLTDEAEALIEHLIDQNPAVGTLQERLQLLQQARVRGISAAYADYQERVSNSYLLQVLMQWLATPSWTASRSFAAAYGNDLLHSLSILDTFGLENPSDLGLRVHCGLLGYAAVTGFDAAYDLLSDASRLQAILADPTTPIGPRFSVAQIYSGLAADDPEGHFQYAVIALRAIFLLPLFPEDVPRAATGMVRQAAAALADCAANAAPYEQRDFALRLDQLAAEDPPLSPYIAEVRHILTGTSSDDPPR